MAKARYMTIEALERHPIPNKRTELVRGRLVIREPAGALHGWVAARLLGEMHAYLRNHPLGELYAAETGFILARHPATLRAPDVAYIQADRVPEDDPGFATIAPDLLAEVLSPDDRRAMVEAKVRHWLDAGTRLVWVIDPRKKRATVHCANRASSTLTLDDALDGEDVIPGLTVPLRRILVR